MRVSVAYGTPARQVWTELEVADHATVREAIEASGVLRMFPDIDLALQKVGVFGKLVALEARLEAGQRVEIYRPITADPRAILGKGDDDDE
jgi:putative ubiquitin-RnfH superfamily antitoxin RatB of RatAB toxin-antitoxin module